MITKAEKQKIEKKFKEQSKPQDEEIKEISKYLTHYKQQLVKYETIVSKKAYDKINTELECKTIIGKLNRIITEYEKRLERLKYV